jgi:hypothetical protein
MTKRKRYEAIQSRNGTEDEITIYTPGGRAMLCVGFWDAEYDNDPAKLNADQLRADSTLIVDALNAYRRARIASLQKAITAIKTRLGVITATMVGDEELPQATLDAAYDHHERLRAVQIVLGCLAETKGARINEAAVHALWEQVEEAQAYLAQPEVAMFVPPIEETV